MRKRFRKLTLLLCNLERINKICELAYALIIFSYAQKKCGVTLAFFFTGPEDPPFHRLSLRCGLSVADSSNVNG